MQKELAAAFVEAAATKDRPTCIIAKTIKGQGFPGDIADNIAWHGKPMMARTEEVVRHLNSLMEVGVHERIENKKSSYGVHGKVDGDQQNDFNFGLWNGLFGRD